MNAQQEFYFENFSGLFSRRPWAGGALAGWLLGVSCGMPLALFWPRWLSQILAVAMPLGSPAGSLLPNPVALAAVVCHFAAAIVQLAVIGRWMRSILLDPAVSLPAGSSSRWQLALTVSLAAYFLVGGLQPVVLWSWWLGSTR